VNTHKLSMLAIVTAVFLSAYSVVQADGPDYDCEARNRACVEACDNAADTGKGANAYNRCLEGCRKSNKICTERQQSANVCAEAFRSCISEAAGDDDAMEGCRDAYRSCKGD